ncbi:MAG: hypothetical protein ACE5G9_13180 [Nitrospinales bacterium]
MPHHAGKKLAVLLMLAGCLSVSSAQAKPVVRQADCLQDKACLEKYRSEKSAWLACLEQAGLSEKKRARLSDQVETLGIRNLRKQEVLIFDSRRKACHRELMNALPAAPKGGRDARWPPPLDSLKDMAK